MGEPIKVTVYDDDGKTNDLVGQTDIQTYIFCRQGGIHEEFSLMYKEKLAGKILLESNYLPPGEVYNPIITALKRQSIALPKGSIILPPILNVSSASPLSSLAEALKKAKQLKME